MTDDEIAALAAVPLPYRLRVEPAWWGGEPLPAGAIPGVNLLTPAEAAMRLGVSRTHIYGLVAARKLRRFNASAKPGSPRTRIADADTDAYIAAAEMPVPSFDAFSQRRP
jgi:excisionase family DNA binding protein